MQPGGQGEDFNMKSVKQWFEALPEPYKTQALNNTQQHRVTRETTALSGAVMIAFEWGKTTEGFDYWDSLYRKIQKGEIREIQINNLNL